MCYDETYLRNVWLSLFDTKIYTNLKDPNKEVLGPVMLLETAIASLRQLGFGYSGIFEDLALCKEELKIARSEINILKEKLEETREPCQECVSLTKQLAEAKKKAKEAENTVKSIVKIINCKDTDSQSNAMALVSQMFTESPQRKKRCLQEKDDNADQVNAFLIQESEDLIKRKAKLGTEEAENKIVPETEITPKKVVSKLKNISKSPTVGRNSKFSENLEKETDFSRTPRRSLSSDFVQGGGKQISFDIEVRLVEEGGADGQSPPGRNARVVSDRVQASPRKSPKKKGVWRLKQKSGLSGRGRKMKQLTLDVEKPDKLVDLSVTPLEHSSDEEDIILPSPTKQDGATKKQTDTELSFAPHVTSTQKTQKDFSNKIDSTVKLEDFASSSRAIPKLKENSFDVLPNAKPESPNYAYKGKTVRGKKRANLPAWDCEECQQYYQLAGRDLNASKIRNKINICSRHRSKHPLRRHATPPGFWDVDMPSSEDAKRMYTSVYLDQTP